MTNLQMPSLCSRASGRVKRYATWPTIQEQTTGDHTWQVMRIYREIFGLPDPEMFEHMLLHDGGEVFAGDPPYPITTNYPDYDREHAKIEDHALSVIHNYDASTITELQKWRLKVCDLIEMCEFGLYEMRMGNTFGRPIYERTRAGVEKKLIDQPDGVTDEDIYNVKAYLEGINE